MCDHLSTKMYVEVISGCIGHIGVDDNDDVCGFYTTDMQTCIGLALVGRKNMEGRLSFIHHEYNTSDDLLLQEFSWGNRKNSLLYIFSTNPFPLPFFPKKSWDDFFTPNTQKFIKSLGYQNIVLDSYVCEGFNETNFCIDRFGHFKAIDKMELDPNVFLDRIETKVWFYKNLIRTSCSKCKETKIKVIYQNQTHQPDYPLSPQHIEHVNSLIDFRHPESEIFDFNDEEYLKIWKNHKDWRIYSIHPDQFKYYHIKEISLLIHSYFTNPDIFLDEIMAIPKFKEHYLQKYQTRI